METKNYTEKRRSPRVLCGKKIRAFVQPVDKPMHVHDISYHGALLKTRTSISTGDKLDLSMDLPFDSASIKLSAKVVRTVTICNPWGFCNFNIGIEFMDLIEAQKKVLTKTVDHLLTLMKQEARV